MDAGARLSRVSQVSAGQILADDSNDLGKLYQEVTQVRVDIEPADQRMRWVWRFSPAFSVLPAVNQEIAAWANQMERVQRDLDAASALLDSCSQLLDIYSEAQTVLQTGGASHSDSPLEVKVADLEASYSFSSQAIEDARRMGRSFSIGLQAPWIRDLRGLLENLEDRMSTASQVGQRVSRLTGELLELEGSDDGLLDDSGGLVKILDAVAERGDQLAELVAELEEAQHLLAELASSGDGASFVGGGVSDIARFVDSLHAGLQLVHRLAPTGGAILGSDGARKYLVLGQSADELRATGGFVSSVWLATFENGGLADVRYQDSVRVDDWDRLALYPKAPLGLEEHMNAWVWLLRDVSWDPNFPTTARTAADMYWLGQRQRVDGVVAINQWTLLRLIEALGSIASPDGGEPITARNLLSVLEEGTDRYGRAYMDLVLQGLLDKLNQPVSMPALIRLASAINDTLQSGDLLVFFDDPSIQSVIAEAGWDGSVGQGSMDYVRVVDSNVGWSKVDRNIQRDVSYVVDLRRDSRPRATLTLGYSNHSGPGSVECEPQWLSRGTNYSQLKNACYWNFLRVYMPQGSRLLSSTPLPLPGHTVSVEIGRGIPGQDTGNISSSHNKMVFSGLTSVRAGSRGEITLVYDLPDSVVRREADSLTYELLIQKQPGVRERRVHVELITPEGYGISSSSMTPYHGGNSRAIFDLTLTQDTVLRVEFTRGSDGSG